MNKKYILFNNPATLLIIIGGIVILVIGVSVLSSLWRGNDFAVGFFIACISVILVNAVFAFENKNRYKSSENNIRKTTK
jgi:cytosine/uracil/thiamine/allantoin permease